jgi:cyclase
MKNLKRLTPDPRRYTRFGETPHFIEGLYDLGQGIYAWMVPNGSWGESNAGLIVCDGQSLLVDTLWDLDLTRGMLAAMHPLTQQAPIGWLVNTHADGDHFWGNQLVEGAEIMSTAACRAEMAKVRPQAMALFARTGRFFSRIKWQDTYKAGHWFQAMVAPYDFQGITPALPTRIFDGELRTRLGGREVHLIQAGPAHTAGDLMVYVPDARMLFAGDVVFVESTPVLWAGPLENLYKALDRILAMPVDLVVPGHGPVTDKYGVRLVRSYWEYLEAQVHDRFARGLPAWKAAREIALSPDFAKQPFAKWNAPERIMTSVHTLYRHLKGRKRPPGVISLVNLMRRQALLAHDMPGSQPAIMRL